MALDNYFIVMEKIRKVFPLRRKPLNRPVVFAFNININHYGAYGDDHYQRVKKTLEEQGGEVHMLPIVTNQSMGI